MSRARRASGCRGRLAGLVLVGVVACATACRSRPGPDAPDGSTRAPPDAVPAALPAVGARLVDVEWERRVWPDRPTLSLSEPELERELKHTLTEAGVFGDPKGRETIIRVQYGVSVTWSGERAAGVQAAVMLRSLWAPGHDEPTLAVHVLTEADLDGEKGAALVARLREHMHHTLADATQQLVAEERVRAGSADVVVKALDDTDRDVRQVALAQIGERHLRVAVPRLLELLKSPDEIARDGAIGALVALRAQEAVPVLTELAQFRDLDLMRRVVDAVGEIGGDDARAYLEFVADGHSEDVIRQMAKNALEHLREREGP